MASPLFFEEDLPKNINSKYEAVVVAGLRARELQRGIRANVDKPEAHKYTTLAMMEMLDDQLSFDRGAPMKRVEPPSQDPLT